MSGASEEDKMFVKPKKQIAAEGNYVHSSFNKSSNNNTSSAEEKPLPKIGNSKLLRPPQLSSKRGNVSTEDLSGWNSGIKNKH